MARIDTHEGADAATPAHADADQQSHAHNEPLGILVLGALGVVYGDIGTSPIYAFREALHAANPHGAAERGDILGLLSLIVWSLTLVVTVKYVLFVLRADNNGEGGTLSLMAFAMGKKRNSLPILALGTVGASLFLGDAIITPAISVLSALEGLEVVTPTLTPFVVPLTLAVLLGLFAVQRFGTAGVAAVFGPIMLIWFLTLGVSGLIHIFDGPDVLLAISPHYAVAFLVGQPEIAFVTVGAVFLAVTGAEALYADLGHFGRRPIVTAWLALVFPCLLLNYFGQGAFVLAHGGRPHNPFFEMLPGWGLLPMVGLAAAATIIASQAVISGAFSLIRQAVALNLLPRFEIIHTSSTQAGQIYLPRVNLLLAMGVLILVVGFGSSSALAAAYGISVTGEMLVTTVLLFVVMRRRWKWALPAAALATALFGVLDLGFFTTNIVKVADGGWVSLAVAAVLVLIILTWVRGSRMLMDRARRSEVPFTFIAERLAAKAPHLVPGTAVFLTGDPVSAPTALMHSLKHYKVLHERNVILSVVTEQRPRVPDSERVDIEVLSPLFMRMKVNYGYMDEPDIPRALANCRALGHKFDMMGTSFFLSRRSLKPAADSGMPLWQDRLFIGLARTAADATEYFQIPTGRVVEIGTQVKI